MLFIENIAMSMLQTKSGGTFNNDIKYKEAVSL